MDLFTRIRNKALQAAQEVASFVQRNPSPASFVNNTVVQPTVQRLQPQIQQAQQAFNNQANQLRIQNNNERQLIHQGINNSTIVPARAIQTDFAPQIDALAQILNKVSPKITPLTDILSRTTGMKMSDIAKTGLDMITGGAYSPQEQSFIAKKRVENPQFTPEELQAGKSLGEDDMIAIGLMSSNASSLRGIDAERAAVSKTINEILSGRNKPLETTIRYLRPAGTQMINKVVDEAGNVTKVKRMTTAATKDIPRSVLPSSGKVVGELPAPKTPVQTKPWEEAGYALPEGRTPESRIEVRSPSPAPVDPFLRDLKNNGVNAGNKVSQFVDKAFVQTRERLQKVFGKETFDKNVDPVLTKYTERMKAGDLWIKAQQDRMSQVVKTYGVKPGSEEDRLIQLFKKDNGFEQVSKRVGIDRAKQLEALYNELRTFYDSAYKMIRDNRVPAGMKPPNYKKDFLSEIGGKKSGFNLGFDPSVSGEVSGGIFKKQGENTNVGAIESMTNYLEKAARAGFTDLSAKEFTDMADVMSQVPGVSKEAIDIIRNLSSNISGANKTSSGVQRAIEGYAGMVKGAAVVGKVSTLVNQGLSLPHGIANAGPINFVKSLFSKEAEMASKESGLLISLSKKTPDNLRTGNLYSKAVQKGGDALQFANEGVYKTIWKGIYEKAKQMGVGNPVQWADNETARVLGDRRAGLTPEIYNTFFGKIFSAFTLEQTASITSLAQNIGNKKWGVVLGTLLAWKIGNELNEKYGTGVSPYIDPLDTVIDTLDLWNGTDKVEKNKVKSVLRPLVEGLKLAPQFTPALFTAYKVGEYGGVLPPSQDVLPEDPTWMNTANLLDPFSNKDRRITGNDLVDKPLNIASKFVPGLGQAITTAKGVKSVAQGFAESNAGNVMFETPQDLLSVGRQVLFGPNSTQEARDYFNKGVNTTLTKDQTETYKTLPKEQRTGFLKNKQNSTVANSRLNSILGGEKTTTGSSGIKDHKEAKAYVNKALDGGVVPAKEDIKLGLFNNKSASSSLVQERMDVYKAIGKAMDSEDYTEEQKQAIVEASGAKKEAIAYYLTARKDMDVKLQELIPTLEAMPLKERMQFLSVGRMKLGGQQLVTSEMITYLYDNQLIGENEKELLSNLKFDEGQNKFYTSLKFGSGGGGKKLTFAQAKKLYSIPRIEFKSPSSKQTGSSGSKLIEDILLKKPKTRKKP